MWGEPTPAHRAEIKTGQGCAKPGPIRLKSDTNNKKLSSHSKFIRHLGGFRSGRQREGAGGEAWVSGSGGGGVAGRESVSDSKGADDASEEKKGGPRNGARGSASPPQDSALSPGPGVLITGLGKSQNRRRRRDVGAADYFLGAAAFWGRPEWTTPRPGRRLNGQLADPTSFETFPLIFDIEAPRALDLAFQRGPPGIFEGAIPSVGRPPGPNK